MTGIGRFFGSRDDVPAWAAFFTAKDYRRFDRLVEEDLRRRGVPFERGNGVVRVDLPGLSDSTCGLQNLAQSCHAQPPDSWTEIVRRHFDTVLTAFAGGAADPPARPFGEASPLLKVRLYPADFGEGELRARLVGRPFAEGILEVLVHDLPDQIRTVAPEETEAWDVPREDLFRIARDNVRAAGGIERHEQDAGEGVLISALIGDGFFVASHALLLDEHVPDPPEAGVLVGIPHRHAVVFHPIRDLKALHAVEVMIQAVFGMYQEGPGSISPDLYWRRAGRWTRLPSKVSAESIRFMPPDDFVAVLHRLAGP